MDNTVKTRNRLVRSVFSLFLIIALLFTSLASASKLPTEGLTLEKVNVRKRASLNSVIEARLEQGTVITLLRLVGSFYEIEHEGVKGYIHKDYVQIGTTPTATPELPKFTTLSHGSKGAEVLALQEALTELRFYSGELDANYGKSTKDAVSAFQKKNNLKVDGKAGDQVQRLIYDGSPKNKSGNSYKVKTLAPLPGMQMKYGSRGQAVADLQNRLKELGYYRLEITRSYDMRTRQAVTKFQQKNGIKKSLGNATAETQALLYSKLAIPADVKPTPAPTPLPPMPTEKLVRGKSGAQVSNLQKVLTGLGYYTGKATGKYDNKTIDAVTEFQKKNGLKADGVAGDNTLNQIFSPNAVKKDGSVAEAPRVTPVPQQQQPFVYPNINNNTRALKEGDSGDDVLAMQRRLTQLGYYKARSDSKFLADDRAAVIAFQRRNGLSADGVANVETLQKLYSANAIAYSGSYNGNISNPGATPAPLSVTLRMGDKGEAVYQMQERLRELNYLTAASDGNFGSATKRALIAFQRANQMSADGVAGAATLSLLYSKSALNNTTQPSGTILKKGQSSAAVRTLQETLIRLGYMNGPADGKFGANTQLALMKFQSRNNLKSDGIAGLSTLNALNSSDVVLAPGAKPTPKPTAPPITQTPLAAQVRFENWYTYLRSLCRRLPNITVYDYSNGISWQLKVFSTGTHADCVPVTAQDTENMMRAFGGKNTWTPKPVWVQFSDGSIYMATTHNVPHGTDSANANNNFPGHLCLHFPRTLAQVQAIGPYAVSHQTAVEVGWQQTQLLQKQ